MNEKALPSQDPTEKNDQEDPITFDKARLDMEAEEKKELERLLNCNVNIKNLFSSDLTPKTEVNLKKLLIERTPFVVGNYKLFLGNDEFLHLIIDGKDFKTFTIKEFLVKTGKNLPDAEKIFDIIMEEEKNRDN